MTRCSSSSAHTSSLWFSVLWHNTYFHTDITLSCCFVSLWFTQGHWPSSWRENTNACSRTPSYGHLIVPADTWIYSVTLWGPLWWPRLCLAYKLPVNTSHETDACTELTFLHSVCCAFKMSVPVHMQVCLSLIDFRHLFSRPSSQEQPVILHPELFSRTSWR